MISIEIAMTRSDLDQGWFFYNEGSAYLSYLSKLVFWIGRYYNW